MVGAMLHTITLIPGDGIGPEVSEATQKVLAASGVTINWEVHNAGAAVAEQTGSTLPDSVLESVRKNKVALKGPIGTPIGKGFKSVNVTLRQSLDLYANVRPIRSLHGLEPRFEGTDIVIVRENTEDLYAGLELMIMPGIAQSIKLITATACMRICEYAFRYAERMNRKRVSVVHKANIMKISDGLLLDCFREVAQKHPKIEPHEIIVDACAMQMVRNANVLDVLVTENLYGDILSDLGAGLVGGLGIVPGANIGLESAVFEAVHGTAPDIAGKGLANPTALIQSAVMMLQHVGETLAATKIERAIIAHFKTSNVKTRDLGGTATTAEFTDALCEAVAKT
jgi:isocitrate dehydrogenase (NAD+)